MKTLTVEIPLDDKFSENLETFRMLFLDYTDDELIKIAFSLGVRSIVEEQQKLEAKPKALKYRIAEYDTYYLVNEREITEPEVINYFKNQGTYIELTAEHLNTLESQFGFTVIKNEPYNLLTFEVYCDIEPNFYGTPEDGLSVEKDKWTLTIDSRVVPNVTITEEILGMKWITLSNYQVICGGGVTWEDAILDFKRSLYANAECFATHARKNATVEMEDETYTGYNDEYPGLFAAGYSKEEFERDYELAAQQWFICSRLSYKPFGETHPDLSLTDDIYVIWSEEDKCYAGLSHKHPMLSHLSKHEEIARAGIIDLVSFVESGEKE